jgi:hypothetical protein
MGTESFWVNQDEHEGDLMMHNVVLGAFRTRKRK